MKSEINFNMIMHRNKKNCKNKIIIKNLKNIPARAKAPLMSTSHDSVVFALKEKD